MGEEINFGLGLGFAESKTTGLGFGKVHYPAKYSAESRTRYTPSKNRRMELAEGRNRQEERNGQ